MRMHEEWIALIAEGGALIVLGRLSPPLNIHEFALRTIFDTPISLH